MLTKCCSKKSLRIALICVCVCAFFPTCFPRSFQLQTADASTFALNASTFAFTLESYLKFMYINRIKRISNIADDTKKESFMYESLFKEKI